MRNINYIIRNTAICIFAAMLSVSCLLEKDGQSAEMQGVMIQLNVTAGDMTKAVSEAPAEMEKVINTLRIYAFYGNRLAGYSERQSTALGEPFYMDLTLPETGTHDVDFYLIANEQEMAYRNGIVQLSENMTRTELEDLKFTGLVSAEALPMYCSLRVPVNVDNVSSDANSEPGHEGHYLLDQKVTFELSRSLAKLSVYAAKAQGAATDPMIWGVTLLSAGTREYSYLFEKEETVLDAIPSLTDRALLADAPVVITRELASGSAEVGDPAYYDQVVWSQYLPEVSAGTDLETDKDAYRWNVDSGDQGAAVLHIEYALGENMDRLDGYVYLPRINRNTHVKVFVLINAEGRIIINYTVADWDWDEDNMHDWFFDYPTHSYVWHSIPETEEDLDSYPPFAAEMSETQPFTGYFQMSAPDSDRWVPTLEGLNASYCRIEVYDGTGNPVFTTEDPSPLEVSSDWYTIKVFPEAGYMDVGDVVNLAITYTPGGGFAESEYLLINGAYQDYFWPGSSNENYVTITMVN